MSYLDQDMKGFCFGPKLEWEVVKRIGEQYLCRAQKDGRPEHRLLGRAEVLEAYARRLEEKLSRRWHTITVLQNAIDEAWADRSLDGLKALVSPEDEEGLPQYDPDQHDRDRWQLIRRP